MTICIPIKYPEFNRHPAMKTMRAFTKELSALCDRYSVLLVHEKPSDDIELLKLMPEQKLFCTLDDEALESEIYILNFEVGKEVGK